MVSAYTVQTCHHKANVSLKNLRTVVLTDVEDVMSVWYEIYSASPYKHSCLTADNTEDFLTMMMMMMMMMST